MKTRIIALCAALTLMLSATALAAAYRIDDRSADGFGRLIIDLLHAYETPSDGDAQAIGADLDAIASVSGTDGKLARSIADHWQRVYLDKDYRLRLYTGDSRATELEQSALQDSPTHAFVVLGFQLKNGKMTDELKGRCEAAAAAARSFPSAMLFCSGGATGDNNPKGYTEAGLMKAYLTGHCGIDAQRIHTDEKAMTTLENAVNTFEMMRQAGIETFTIVTSSYHQRWGQAIYNCMAEMLRLSDGHSPELVENYSFDIAPSDHYRHDDQFAARQLCALLKLPDRVIEDMKKAF